MQKAKKLIILTLITNALSACSSPPKLSEPKGEWISFEPLPVPTPIRQVVSNTQSHPTQQPEITVIPPVTAGDGKTVMVKLDGKNVPLYNAVRTVVPASWGINLAPDVAQNFRGNVSWYGNDQWPHVLRKMLLGSGLDADINDARKEVSIKYGNKPVIAAKPASVLTVKKEVTTLQPPVIPAVTQNAPVPAAKPAMMATTAATPKPVIAPVREPKAWKIDKGPSLRKLFEAWVAKETCPVGDRKWELRWETDTDYSIDDPLLFHSDSFEDVTNQLFSLYSNAKVPLYVHGFRPQCLIIVNEQR